MIFTCMLALLVLCSMQGQAQEKDSVKAATSFSGTIGGTNNGFSIIPSFSFNSPAVLAQLFWVRRKFSIDPDIRVAPSGKKGSVVLWFRYQVLDGKRFSFRVGGHPAVNWFPRTIQQNGTDLEVYQLRRFLAWELAPTIKLTRHWQVGLYYLQGNGLQRDGAQTIHFVNLFTSVNEVRLLRHVNGSVTPAFFYLYQDGNDGTYFTATGSLHHTKIPLILQSTINKTIHTTIPGNKDFIWNIALLYSFKNTSFH